MIDPAGQSFGLYASIADANGQIIGTGQNAVVLTDTLSVKNDIGEVLNITPQSTNKNKKRSEKQILGRGIGLPLKPWSSLDDVVLAFTIGSQSWDSTSSQCTVGGWDKLDSGDVAQDPPVSYIFCPCYFQLPLLDDHSVYFETFDNFDAFDKFHKSDDSDKFDHFRSVKRHESIWPL